MKSWILIILERFIENNTSKQPEVSLLKIIRSQNLFFCYAKPNWVGLNTGQECPWSIQGRQGQQWWHGMRKGPWEGKGGDISDVKGETFFVRTKGDTTWGSYERVGHFFCSQSWILSWGPLLPSLPEWDAETLCSLLLSPPSPPMHFSVASWLSRRGWYRFAGAGIRIAARQKAREILLLLKAERADVTATVLGPAGTCWHSFSRPLIPQRQ